MILKSAIEVTDAQATIASLKSNARRLVIFGTGNYGSLAAHALKKHGIEIDRFCDNNTANWGTRFHGRQVISPEELLGSFPDAVVIIASLRFKYMACQLRNAPNIRILHCDFLFAEIELTDIEASAPQERLIWMLGLYMFAIDAARDEAKVKIKSLDVVVTEKCSLKCRSCSNLMQYYRRPSDTRIDLLLSALDRFLANVDALYEARVIGGEPFVYKNLAPVIRTLCAHPNCRKVAILTNGTLVPNDETLESLMDDKVLLIISNYGKLSKNIARLEALLDQWRIPYICYDIDSWQDCAEIAYRQRTEEELVDVFGDCCVNDALTLLHGRLYACPFSAHVNNLSAVPPEHRDDAVDLTGADGGLLRDRIRDLASGRKYLKACSFCSGRHYGARRTEVALQSPAPLPLKTYEIK